MCNIWDEIKELNGVWNFARVKKFALQEGMYKEIIVYLLANH